MSQRITPSIRVSPRRASNAHTSSKPVARTQFEDLYSPETYAYMHDPVFTSSSGDDELDSPTFSPRHVLLNLASSDIPPLIPNDHDCSGSFSDSPMASPHLSGSHLPLPNAYTRLFAFIASQTSSSGSDSDFPSRSFTPGDSNFFRSSLDTIASDDTDAFAYTLIKRLDAVQKLENTYSDDGDISASPSVNSGNSTPTSPVHDRSNPGQFPQRFLDSSLPCLKRKRSWSLDEHAEEPLTKRSMPDGGFVSSTALSRTLEKPQSSTPYTAQESASLRKAHSLRSEKRFAGLYDKENLVTDISKNAQHIETPKAETEDLVPTRPATPPSALTSPASISLRSIGGRSSWAKLPLNPPPRTTIKRTLSDEAEGRLKVLVERERKRRCADPYLQRLLGSSIRPGLPVTDTTSGRMDEVDELDMEATQNIEDYATQYAIDDELRRECVRWILEILPAKRSPGNGLVLDLFQQLKGPASGETRFHAAFLFNRYFLRVGPRNILEEEEDKFEWEMVAWDAAVACLALSVKFHRDALKPLHPVQAIDFIRIHPRSTTFEDLETMHREVFAALDFNIGGPTPGAYMSELWAALVTLRGLLIFDGGWKAAQNSAWDVLLDAIEEPDVLRFPIYILTATALVVGILDAMTDKLAVDDCARRRENRRDGDPAGGPISSEGTLKSGAKCRRRAERVSKHAIDDIINILGVNRTELKECAEWIDKMY